MNLGHKSFVASAAVAAAFALASPAWAQHQSHGSSAHVAAARPAPSRAAAPVQHAQSAPAPRYVAAPRTIAPRAQVQTVPRAGTRFESAGRPVEQFRGNVGVGRAGSRFGVAPRSVIVAPRQSFYFARPYYAFRPHFSLGVGLFVGYPVAFPYGYNPYLYADPYYDGYAYPDTGGYSVAPTVAYGGLSFDIQPQDASVYIDGNYVGIVADFSPNQAPLSLTAGRHHVELRAQGCEPMAFDISVMAGQVIPYQGTLSYIR